MVALLLRERQGLRAEITKHLVGQDMKEMKVIDANLFDMVAAGLDHAERSHDVGHIEGSRP